MIKCPPGDEAKHIHTIVAFPPAEIQVVNKWLKEAQTLQYNSPTTDKFQSV